jgi:hypothetical protein
MSEELKPLSKKHQKVLYEYLICFSQWRAYKAAYPNVTDESARTLSSKLFANVDFLAHLQVRLSDIHMSVEEALARETEIGRVGVGFFFKMTDEWMFNPLPEYETLDEREVVDDTKEPPQKRINYRVRHAVLDMDKVLDPQYAHLVKKFSNSRKNGISIELYDGQTVHNNVLKMAGKFVEKHEHTGKDGAPLIPKEEDNERFDRAISTLADALRDSISRTGKQSGGEVDTSK